jgi:cytochrome c oxidase assembly protein subunit 11
MKKDGVKNLRLLGLLLLCVAGMAGIAYASVPLYTLFCKATGYGGATKRAEAAPAQTKERWITVTFDSNVERSLPWDFKPETKNLQAKLGETYTVNYQAHNRGDAAVAGMATDNVQPDKAGGYFDKIKCFCFEKLVLKPGQTVALPVQFYIDPALADDRNADDIQNITLSYTFFRAKDQGKTGGDSRRPPAAPPQPKTSGNPS